MTASRARFDSDDMDEMLRAPSSRVEDPFGSTQKKERSKIGLLPSQWVERFVRIKNADTGTVDPMDFSQRKYLLRPYNTPARRVLFMTSRQTEKSTTLGNKLMSLAGMRSIYTSLFVSPSAMQTKVFSTTRLDDIINVSPLLKSMTHRSLIQNLLEKEFVNKSKIYLRYAFLSADRIRGLSVNALFCDEVQDLMQDLLPVIEETTSHHKDPLFCYSGTPKTLDNTIEVHWSRHSTQNEWVIPCERHGTPNNPSSWHWVILGPKNIGKFGPICDKCGGGIDPEHPMAQWCTMNPGAQFEGFRICRLMVPWFVKDPTKWQEILDAMERYPTAQFMNEVLALSYDSGEKPLSRHEVIRCCDDAYTNDEDQAAELGQKYDLYAGIDWSGGGVTGAAYTVLTVGGYVRGDVGFQLVFAKRFTGPLAEPDAMMKELIRLLRKFRIKYIGVDFGGGFFPNKELTSIFGPKKVYSFHYMGKLTAKIAYKPQLHRFLAFRSLVMADIFQAIKKVKIRFFAWDKFREPFSTDLLSIRSEYNEAQKILQYIKIPGVPDDTFHSLGYALMVSMLDHRRPDIFAPLQENGPDQQALAAEEHMARELEDLAVMNYEDPGAGPDL
jgi:hypothetical protein